MQRRCEFPYPVAEFINSIQCAPVQFSNQSSFRKTNTKYDPANRASPSKFPRARSRNAHRSRKQSVNSGAYPVGSRCNAAGSIHESIQAGAPTDQEPAFGAELCRGTTDRAVGNAAGKIQAWKTEERECPGLREREGTECFPTAQREEEEGTDEPAFNAQSRLPRLFDGSRS
jgi:hypothetical protein